jgi:hypothetical protein
MVEYWVFYVHTYLMIGQSAVGAYGCAGIRTQLLLSLVPHTKRCVAPWGWCFTWYTYLGSSEDELYSLYL